MPRKRREPSAEGLPEYLTPPEVARIYRVRESKVLGWIRAQKVRAINVAADSAKQPRYRIARAWLADLDTALAAFPPRQQRRRPAAKTADVRRHFRG